MEGWKNLDRKIDNAERKQQERDSATTNDTAQLNVLAFSAVPDGIRPQSSQANSGKGVFKHFRQEAVGDL